MSTFSTRADYHPKSKLAVKAYRGNLYALMLATELDVRKFPSDCGSDARHLKCLESERCIRHRRTFGSIFL